MDNSVAPDRQQSEARASDDSNRAKRRRNIDLEIAATLVGVVAVALMVSLVEARLGIIDQLTAISPDLADQTIVAITFLGLAGAIFSYRRWREAQAEITQRQKVESALRALQGDLEHRVQARTAELTTANEALQVKIAEHKRTSDSLSQLEEFNQRLVVASPIGIMYLDQDTRITYENPAMRRMMGVPENAHSPVIGQKLLELPPIQGSLSATAAQALLAGEVISAEAIHYRSLMGPETDLEFYSAPLRAAPGQSGGTILLVVDVTTRARTQAELAQRLAELEAIGRITAALRTAQTLQDMLPVLTDETMSILGGSAGGIWLYDMAYDDIRLAFERGWRGTRPEPLKLGQGVPGQVMVSGRPYLARDLSTELVEFEPDRARALAGMGAICVPIRAAEQIIGAMYINAELPREFTAADAHLLTTLAEIAGNAIHRTTLHEQTQRRLRQLTALAEIDRAISSTFGLSLSLSQILSQLLTLLGVDAADILTYKPSVQTLEFAAGQGFRTEAFARARLRMGEGNAGRAALERQLVHVSDLTAQRDNPRLARAMVGEAFVSYFGVPLVAKGKIQGVLEIFQRTALEPNQEWLDFLNTLAGQAAIAIDNATLFESLQRSNTDLALAYDATIEGWSRALDLRDKETEGHSQRVTTMSEQLARCMQMSADELVQLRRGALLHDIGKMGVPDHILLKPGPLTDDEWVIMRRHPALAFQMLAPIHYLRQALDIPYCHHEKWDGSGYPRGLAGEQIPLAARIFAVVDVRDALRSDRPYRPAWPDDKVRDYIRQQSGRHFDPGVVEAFLHMDLTQESQGVERP